MKTMSSTKEKRTHRKTSGFTLLELLVVITIIALLAGILIPVTSRVRQSASESRTKAQFSQWIQGIESYRQEFGYYPSFNYTDPNDNVFAFGQDPDARHAFITILTGRELDGSSLPEGHPNERGIEFYQFSESDLEYDGTDIPFILDGFGNREIVVIVDRNQRGLIRPGDLDVLPEVSSVRTPEIAVSPEIPERGIREGVLIYSAGAGGTSETEAQNNMVRSWE